MEEKKENKVTLGDDGIIYVEIVKADSEEDVIKMIDELIAAIKNFTGEPKVFLNVETISIIYSRQFREKVGEKFKKIIVAKAAMCGGNLLTRKTASFIINHSKLENVRIFETREEALVWLHEE